MRTLTLFTLWMLSLGCSGTGAPIPAPEEWSRPPIAADAPLRIKVLSYNIHHGRGADGRIDLPRIAAVIERSGADLVALQEVDRGTARSGWVDQAAVLAETLGYQYAFVTAIEYDGGQYGEALLTRGPTQARRGIPLRRRLPEEEDRAAIEVVADPWGRDSVRFIGTHLSHESGTTRTEQVVALKTSLESDPIPAILAGDFNFVQGSTAYLLMIEGWLDTARRFGSARDTYPSDRPDRRIDYVFARPKERWRVLSVTVLDERVASDHLPLLVELELLPVETGDPWGALDRS